MEPEVVIYFSVKVKAIIAFFLFFGLSPIQAADRIAVLCGRLIDGVSDVPKQHAVIIIENGRIERIDRGSAPPSDAKIIDLRRYTVLPGLIDLHTHLTDGPEFSADPAKVRQRTLASTLDLARKNAKKTLEAGFTSVRDVGTYIAWADRALRDEIDAGNTSGPRMQIVGFYLTIPGGGGDVPGATERGVKVSPEMRMGVARGPDEFRKRAELAISGGADWIKVIASGAVLAIGSEPGAPEMSEAEIRAAAEVAHRAGKRLAAHAHGARSIKDALSAGADTIEHASYLDDEGIRLAKTRNVAFVFDVYNGDYIDTEARRNGMPEEFLRKNLETLHRQRESFTRAHLAGLRLAFGTDAAVYPHGDNAKQFRLMCALGMTPMEAIRSATSVAADVMGWPEKVGAVLPGRYADLVAVEGNPLEDITLLEDIPVVIKGGVLVKNTIHATH